MFAKGHLYTCATRVSACSSASRSSKPFALQHILFVFFVTLATFICTPRLHAQFYEYGQDAGSLRWNQFRSGHYRIIYPVGIDSLAMSIADRLEYYYPFQAASIDHRHDLMPVVVHNESSFSNGVFVWAPRRLEIFTNPDPNGYPQDWLSQLSIHEGRHAFQVSKLDQGLTRGLSFIAGEQAQGAMVGFLPLWYLEGDAVDAETRFSRTGRGRLPSFEMGMKALLLEKEQRYSYSKALHGSYKDYVPNYYQLGYFMVRYGRRTYGDELWNDMEDYVARRPYTILPTFFSNRKFGVKSKRYLYDMTFDFYASHWNTTLEQRTPTSYSNWTNPRRKHFTNYRFPQFVNDSQLVAIKTGMDIIPEFVVLNRGGSEQRVFRPGTLNSGRFSYSKGKIAWDEWIPDWRWSNRNFSGIRIYDMENESVRNLGARTRYYAPALSRDGNRIAAIEQRTDHTFRLVILGLDGREQHSIPSPDNSFIQHPAWMEQDSAVIVTLTRGNGEYLYAVSPLTGHWEPLFTSGFDDISCPTVHADKVFFSATFSGIDNLYVYHTARDTMLKVTTSSFGAFDPSVSVDGTRIAYSDYHYNGHHAVTAPLSPELWTPVPDPGARKEQIDFQPTPGELEIIRGAEEIAPGNYEIKPYRKWANAVNIHSWLPLWFDYLDPQLGLSPEAFQLSPGLTIVSQNLLSTVTGLLGYEYRDKMHFLHSGVILKGRVPVVELDLRYGGEPQVYRVDQLDPGPLGANRLLFHSRAYVPIRLNTGKYITFIQPLISWSYASDLFPDASRTMYQQGSHRLLYRTYFTSYLRRGRKDILPRFGIAGSLIYRHAPFDRVNLGSMSALSMSLYLPGPLKHQTIKLGYSKEKQDPLRYLFGSLIEQARGIEPLNAFEFRKYSLDYTFPLLYPDLNIEPLLYIKRIRANAWADVMDGRDILVSDPEPRRIDKQYFTSGIDLLTDCHVLRIAFPLSIGGRFAYRPETGEWRTELLLNVTID